MPFRLILIIALLPGILKAETSPKCPGQQGYYYTNDKSKRNPRKGGFVSNSANVGDYVFIAPTAAVCGSSSVLKFSRVYGNAIIKDEAEVTEKARVYGNAVVSGEAQIAGEAKVSGNAQISGSAVIKGSAWAKGYVKISSGTITQGRHSAPKPKAVAAREKEESAQRNKAQQAQNQKKFLADAENSLKWIMNDLGQGWFGEDKQKGFYRSFKFTKSTIKPPCGFYLRLTKEQKTLDSHCNRTKRVKRKRWTPKGGDYKLVKNCKKEYDNQGEKFFDLRKLSLLKHTDFSNNRTYLHFNSFYFYVGNANSIDKSIKNIKEHARKYCGLK
ncbi:MAG: carbonic anhydrase/acetyltransferase-like protein (isoleucine patch superfamily) [Bacteriovoracaceae bacterium]|jgi:carbonic anhydrase/acetyltransferase-like protein (isoleucine patch superfamily)